MTARSNSLRVPPPAAADALADLPPLCDLVGVAGSAGALSFERRRRTRQMMAETIVRPAFGFVGETVDDYEGLASEAMRAIRTTDRDPVLLAFGLFCLSCVFVLVFATGVFLFGAA